MIPVKDAVRTAASTLREVGEELGEPVGGDLRLEEVELTDDDKFWLVTFSFQLPEVHASAAPLSNVFTIPRKRFKQVKLDAETGRFKGLKDRDL
jgi:hypothetical protein